MFGGAERNVWWGALVDLIKRVEGLDQGGIYAFFF